jgi:hypothetical protein
VGATKLYLETYILKQVSFQNIDERERERERERDVESTFKNGDYYCRALY